MQSGRAKVRQHAPSPRSGYSRLFAPLASEQQCLITRNRLEALAASMCSNISIAVFAAGQEPSAIRGSYLLRAVHRASATPAGATAPDRTGVLKYPSVPHLPSFADSVRGHWRGMLSCIDSARCDMADRTGPWLVHDAREGIGQADAAERTEIRWIQHDTLTDWLPREWRRDSAILRRCLPGRRRFERLRRAKVRDSDAAVDIRAASLPWLRC